MLCRHCYQDIGIFGQKKHVCDEFAYRNPSSNKQREVKEVEYKRVLPNPKNKRRNNE
jgi:hypothetical protein